MRQRWGKTSDPCLGRHSWPRPQISLPRRIEAESWEQLRQRLKMARAKGEAVTSVPGWGGLQMCSVCGLALVQAEECGSLESEPPPLPSPCLGFLLEL